MKKPSTRRIHFSSKMCSSVRSSSPPTRRCARSPKYSEPRRRSGQRSIPGSHAVGLDSKVLGARTRTLSGLRRVGKGALVGTYHSRFRAPGIRRRGSRKGRSPAEDARLPLLPGQRGAVLAVGAEYQPRGVGLPPPPLLARPRVAGGRLNPVVVPGPGRGARAGRREKTGGPEAAREQWFRRVF